MIAHGIGAKLGTEEIASIRVQKWPYGRPRVKRKNLTDEVCEFVLGQGIYHLINALFYHSAAEISQNW